MECAAVGDGIRVDTVHLGSSTRWFGRRYQRPPGANCRLIRTWWLKPGCGSVGLDKLKTSRTAYCSSPRTRPGTRSLWSTARD